MALHLHASNRLEQLSAHLSSLLQNPLSTPLQSEIVVVPGLGMRRWLSLEIARLNDVCANIQFPFIADFISSLQPTETIRQTRPSIQEITWRIHRILPDCLQREEFSAVRGYLSEPDPLKLFLLSGKVAQLFDQYFIYRPQMLSRWTKTLGKPDKLQGDEAWESVLWRLVFNDAASPPTGGLWSEKIADTADLPVRVFVFGLNLLPPLYLEALFEIARNRELHLFLLKPSSEYHGSDLTPKQRARRGIRPSEMVGGNPLLTSLGQPEAHLTELLLEMDERLGPLITTGLEEFEAASGSTLLATLQSDILHAVDRGGPDGESPSQIPATSADRSIQIHSCHSPTREVEVLYDHLLDYLSKDSTLRPRDILVMTPDIEKYSPLIRAVFEHPENGKHRIPYSISDRHPRSESRVLDSFLRLLELATSRCTAEEIFGFTSSPMMAQRFTFSEEDIELIRTWIDRSGIRWGIDAEHRKYLGLPPIDANSWRFGLNRLLLGYAVRGDNRALFQGMLPYDDVEGERGELLGRFVAVTEAIFGLVEKCRVPRRLADWAPLLLETIDQLLESNQDDDVRDLRFLRMTISNLRAIGEGGTNQEVEFAVIREHLSGLLGVREQYGGFLTGGVTFCALKPARSIPARVVCLLGMGDETFPRRPQRPQFDLMSQKWQLGDPSAREDDRYAFLETVISTVDTLYLSYVGRSIVHNQEIPPSVVISELLDYLDQAFTFPGSVSARRYLTIEHPLQAFSPRYFEPGQTDRQLFSYSASNARAAVSSLKSAEPVPAFLVGALTEAESDLRTIDLKNLVRFLAAPAQYFLRTRFGLQLRETNAVLAEEEPIELTALEEYWIRQQLSIERIESGHADLEVFGAQGSITPGTIGQLRLHAFDRETEKFAAQVTPYLTDERRAESLAVDFQLGNFSLTGSLGSIHGQKSVIYRCAALKPRDYLKGWIHHLARSIIQRNHTFETILIGSDDMLHWNPLLRASEVLKDLCELYWEGLTRPLHFFPKSAVAFIKAGPNNPMGKARAEWNGGYDREGEKEDPGLTLLFGDYDPLDDEFRALTNRILGPLFQHAASSSQPSGT